MREQKERAQTESRTLSARITMLERKLKETRRVCEMEKTKISMQYERQISFDAKMGFLDRHRIDKGWRWMKSTDDLEEDNDEAEV